VKLVFVFLLFPLLSPDDMSATRPFKPYLFVYRDKEGNSREVGLHARDSFKAYCLGIELVGKQHISHVDAIRPHQEFDWDDDDDD
jgi:hypothetical protein